MMDNRHGNTGNKYASKPDSEKISQCKLTIALPASLKQACEDAALKEGVKVAAWARAALESKVKDNT